MAAQPRSGLRGMQTGSVAEGTGYRIHGTGGLMNDNSMAFRRHTDFCSADTAWTHSTRAGA